MDKSSLVFTSNQKETKSNGGFDAENPNQVCELISAPDVALRQGSLENTKIGPRRSSVLLQLCSIRATYGTSGGQTSSRSLPQGPTKRLAFDSRRNCSNLGDY